MKQFTGEEGRARGKKSEIKKSNIPPQVKQTVQIQKPFRTIRKITNRIISISLDLVII